MPVEFERSASVPVAVFCSPVVLVVSAAMPMAVLLHAVELSSAKSPRAVLQPFSMTAGDSDRSAAKATGPVGAAAPRVGVIATAGAPADPAGATPPLATA